uniref:Uncharacterized protein n=1 Tax=Magallana gigas TaxID=29159 RepID=K1S2Q3_MAGGI
MVVHPFLFISKYRYNVQYVFVNSKKAFQVITTTVKIFQLESNSCKPLSNQGDLAFDEKGCGIVIESSAWWEEKILNVTGKSDRLINHPRDRNLNIKLGSITNSPEDPSKVWYNFTMPDVKIRLYDKDDHMINKLCSADTDPRMKTFDGKSWTASLAGEFVMYRDTKRRIAKSFRQKIVTIGLVVFKKKLEM